MCYLFVIGGNISDSKGLKICRNEHAHRWISIPFFTFFFVIKNGSFFIFD